MLADQSSRRGRGRFLEGVPGYGICVAKPSIFRKNEDERFIAAQKLLEALALADAVQVERGVLERSVLVSVRS